MITDAQTRVRRTVRGSLALLLTVVTAAAYGLLAAPTAHAEVLVNAIAHRTIRCGGAVKLGIWYQSSSGGPDWAEVRVISHPSGEIVWERLGIAAPSSHWKIWFYHPACGHRYTVSYTVPNHANRPVRASFRFRVRRG